MEKPYLIIHCKYCNKPVVTQNPLRQFCSSSHRQMYYLKKRNSEMIESEIEETLDTEILNGENLINDDMADNQLIAAIQRENALNVELQLLKKDYSQQEKEMNKLQDQSKHIAKLQIENESLEEQISEASDRITELESDLTSERDKYASKFLVLTKQLEREKLENLFRKALITRSQVTFDMVKPLFPDLKMNEADSMNVDGYLFSRQANQKIFTVKKA